jgi:hypothetical protein
MKRRFAAHPQNTDGPFYVVNGECIGCGAPESEAGELISHDNSGHCFFIRQPATSDEVDDAIRALWSSCCGSLRYAGEDHAILSRIAELGEGDSCDERLWPRPARVVRSRVIFEYRGGGNTAEANIKEIIGLIAGRLQNRSDTRCDSFEFADGESSFRFVWNFENSIVFRVRQRSECKWLVRLEENEIAKTGTAVMLDKILRSTSIFAGIAWFTEEEIERDIQGGSPHPY